MGIIGGNKLGFAGVAEAYSVANEIGVGEVRALLPDALKKSVPTTITDTLFAPSNTAGSFAKDAVHDITALCDWASGIVLIGDMGRNSETAIVLEQCIGHYDGPLTITRDAIDLVKNNPRLLVERPNTLLVVSFAQLQKLFQGVYYPKMLAFSMQLLQLVDILHKFTISYPATIMTLHKDTLVIAHAGNVVTQPWENPMAIWRGTTATTAAAWWLWNNDRPLQAVATSLTNS